MVFPFEITFRKKLNLNSSVNSHEVLSFLKTAIAHETPYLKNLKIVNDSFSFKVDFWGVGRGSDFDGVSKGKFNIEKLNDTLILSYTYVIGSNMVILPFFFGIPILILLATDYKKGISMIPIAFLAWVSISILFWFAGLFKMNRKFKRMVRQLETKWVF
jgi:hypothetical protein